MYIDKPKNIGECQPRMKFVNQVFQNYNNLYTQLLLRGIPIGCNFNDYLKLVNGMKVRTLRIIDSYFSCTMNDCTQAILDAYSKFVEFRTNSFNIYTKCSFTYFSPDCAQVLIQARPPVYASVENIMTSLLTCAKLKSGSLNSQVKVML